MDDWSGPGRVEDVVGNLVRGWAEDAEQPGRAVAVAAVSGETRVAVAVTDEAGAFTLILPEDLLRSGAGFLHVVALGSGAPLEGSPVLLPFIPARPLMLRPSRPRPVSAAIKISAPNLKVAHEWGDYHFAEALRAALQRLGWLVRVDCHDAWARSGDEVEITLRGRQRRRPDPDAVSLLWIISHPDRLGRDEIEDFDQVFVAAAPYARTLASTTRRPVEVLHQATDPAVFTGEAPVAPPSPLLFVGNSRRENRRMPRWSVEQGLDLSVYGTLWRGVIPERMIKGEHIANDQLGRWYAGAAVVLNDHWDTMLSGGFLSNRLFDVSAAGGFVITDPVAGLAEVFGDTVETADSGRELAEKVGFYLAHPERARAKGQAAQALVRAAHTFDHRAARIVEAVEAVRRARAA